MTTDVILKEQLSIPLEGEASQQATYKKTVQNEDPNIDDTETSYSDNKADDLSAPSQVEDYETGPSVGGVQTFTVASASSVVLNTLDSSGVIRGAANALGTLGLAAATTAGQNNGNGLGKTLEGGKKKNSAGALSAELGFHRGLRRGSKQHKAGERAKEAASTLLETALTEGTGAGGVVFEAGQAANGQTATGEKVGFFSSIGIGILSVFGFRKGAGAADEVVEGGEEAAKTAGRFQAARGAKLTKAAQKNLGKAFENAVKATFKKKIIRENEILRDAAGNVIGEIDFETAEAIVEVGISLSGKTKQLSSLAEIAKQRGKRLDVIYGPDTAPGTLQALQESLGNKFGNRVRFIPHAGP